MPRAQDFWRPSRAAGAPPLGARAAAAPCNAACESRLAAQLGAPLRFEISPRYAAAPWAARALRQAAEGRGGGGRLPAPPLIFALLRDPAQRAWSQFTMEFFAWEEQCAMEATLAACGAARGEEVARDGAAAAALWAAVAERARARRPAVEAMLAAGDAAFLQNSSSLGRVSSGGGSSAGLACVPRACAASPTQLFHRLVHREMRVLDECYFRTQPHRLESPVGDDDDMALAPLESVAAMGPAEGAACNTSSCSAAAGGLRRLFTRDFRECATRLLRDEEGLPPLANPWAFRRGGLYAGVLHRRSRGGAGSERSVAELEQSIIKHHSASDSAALSSTLLTVGSGSAYRGILADAHHGVLSAGMLARGLYAEQLAPFLYHHDLARLRVIQSEAAYRDEPAAARALLTWALEHASKAASSDEARSLATRALPNGGARSGRGQHHVARHLSMAWRMDDHTRGAIAEWFAPHNTCLAADLARAGIEFDVGVWGTHVRG